MDREQFRRIQTRRNFFQECAGGIGVMALAQLMEREGRGATRDVNPLAPKPPHFPAKAKNVIFMFMEGGPSQLDLFDPKPALQKWSGHPLPPEMTKDLRLAFTKPNAAVLASPREAERMGRFFDDTSSALQLNPKTVTALFPNRIEGLPQAETAAWVELSRVLLNLDEFITRD